MGLFDSIHSVFEDVGEEFSGKSIKKLLDRGKRKSQRASTAAANRETEAQDKIEFQKAEARRKVLDKKRKRELSGASSFGSLLSSFSNLNSNKAQDLSSVLGRFNGKQQ